MIRTPKRQTAEVNFFVFFASKRPVLRQLGPKHFGLLFLAALIGLSTLCPVLATGAPAAGVLGNDTLTTDAMSGGALPFLLEPEVPAMRDIEIAELPFLVGEPPADPDADPEIDLDTASDTDSVTPAPITGSAESSLNPFAPLLSPRLPTPDIALPPATPEGAPEIVTGIVEVPVPPEPPATSSGAPPTAPAETAEAPVPGARLPTTQATALPQRLADNLPNAPDMTDTPSPDARSALAPLGGPSSERTWQGALTEVVAVRPPPGGVGAPVSQHPGRFSPPHFGQNTGQSAGQNTGQNAASGPTRNTLATPAPISLSRSAQNGPPGDTEAARYLDEHQVSFTAMSTGTGVFRTASSSAPVLLAVGEALPDSELVLVSLTQSTAAFAHTPSPNGARDDARHTLSLRP